MNAQGPPGAPGPQLDEKSRKMIRNMSLINFIMQLLQLSCSVAIICLVRFDLQIWTFVTTPAGTFYTYVCYLSESWSGACNYAYSLASISIFFCFILSLMQCLTLDCCGMGRLLEVGFDVLAIAWWAAGGATLASYAAGSTQPAESERAAVIALVWVCVAAFSAMLIVNSILVVKIGRAYTRAQNAFFSNQQHNPYAPNGYNAQQPGVQMNPYPGYGAQQPYAANPYGAQPNPYANQQAYGADPYAAQQPYGAQQPVGPNPYAQQPAAANPYAPPPPGVNPYAQPPPAANPYAAQQPADPYPAPPPAPASYPTAGASTGDYLPSASAAPPTAGTKL